MKILHLSDTHGLYKDLAALPPADVVIHSGDFLRDDTNEAIMDFIEWLGGALPHKHKIFIAGNHDDALYGATIEGLPEGVHYLCHSGVMLDGVRFWGVPYFVEEDAAGVLPERVARIPTDTDVLISHLPPFGILDEARGCNFGSSDLLEAVRRVRPRLHLFGHAHDAHGVETHGGTIFSNGALVDENYRLKNEPHVFDI